MDPSDLHPSDDYSHRFFIWHEWVQHPALIVQANQPLTSANVFDYFATSMFYDKQSNNQVLRMQTMHTGMPVENEAEELRRFTGIEFAVVHSEPGPPSLFIIQKRERLSPDEVRPLAAYFIVNDRIYQSPDLYSVLSNRLLTTLHSLQSSLNILRAHRPDYTPRSGFAWPIAQMPSESNENAKSETTNKSPVTDAHTLATSPPPESSSNTDTLLSSINSSLSGPKKKANQLPLFNAMRTTATQSKVDLPPPLALPALQDPVSQPPLLRTDSQGQLGTPSPNSSLPVNAVAGGTSTPRIGTPKGTPLMLQDGPKALGAMKKKKKRQSIAPS